VSKSHVYKMVLSDGQKVERPAQSAAEAIETALRDFRMRKVVSCYVGLTEDEARSLRTNGIAPGAMAGVIDFEVPEHSAYDEQAVFAPRARKIDHSDPMFNDESIKEESTRAKEKRDREFQINLPATV
jgi:hypothetical protein